MRGHDVVRDADAVRHLIGYMPFFGVYKDMEVTEYLDFWGLWIPPKNGKRRCATFSSWWIVGKARALIGVKPRHAAAAGIGAGLDSRSPAFAVGRTGQRSGSSGAN